jgi:hypothetical protein
MRFVDLTHRTFGRLYVIGRAENKGCHVAWQTVCKCGNRPIVTGCHLTGGQQSCGCLNRERAAARHRLPSGVAARNAVWNVYRTSAKRRGFVWELTFDEFCRLTSSDCHYCDETPKNDIGREYNGSYMYNGIDRKDNLQGYIASNVVSCCDVCNKAKRTMSYEQFVAWLIKAGGKQIQRRECESNFATA